MTRVKTVFPLDDLVHLFAHQGSTNARNAKGNVFISGDTIYSYGTHFAIAKHVTNKKKEKALLFTTRDYSNSTIKHKYAVRSACSHLNIIYCYNPESSHQDNLTSYHNLIKGELEGLTNARKPEKYIEPAKSILADMKKYCEFFSLKVPKHTIELIEGAESGEYKEYLQKEAKRIEAKKKADEKKKLRKFQETVVNWREGKSSRLYDRLFDRDYLRLNGNKRIETSQGVEIPLQVGKTAFHFIKSAISNGGCENCDYKILNYNVSSITPNLLTIGCHKIEISEINNIAKQLNW